MGLVLKDSCRASGDFWDVTEMMSFVVRCCKVGGHEDPPTH